MRLVRWLWLWGALVPLLVVVLLLFGAGLVLHGLLLGAVDRALMSQAATEAVSLFDGQHGEPHLHLSKSPLEAQVRAYSPITWLFEPSGELLGVYPPDTTFRVQSGGPRLATNMDAEGPLTLEVEGQTLRVYTLRVRAHDGSPYILQLAASLAPVRTSVRALVLTSLGIVLLLGFTLLLVHRAQAQRLAARLLDIRAQLTALSEGLPIPTAASEEPGDEIAEVRAALAEAAAQVSASRSAQSQLIARAAHELRTPLALMRTTLDLALRRERPNEALQEALRDTRSEVERLTDVAASLLELSAPELRPARPAELPWSDLRELLQDAVAAADAEAHLREVRLEFDGPQQATARLELHAMRRAIDNLLSNALRFAPRNSVVRLMLSAGADGGYRIEVEDEGPGIPAEHREEVFRPFVRLSDDDAGAGLGLALVREVVRRHGGSVQVMDSVRGARLVMELPAAP